MSMVGAFLVGSQKRNSRPKGGWSAHGGVGAGVRYEIRMIATGVGRSATVTVPFKRTTALPSTSTLWENCVRTVDEQKSFVDRRQFLGRTL
jgi:hypothetical protein